VSICLVTHAIRFRVVPSPKLLMTRLVMKGEVGAMRGNPTKFDFRNEARR